MRTRRIFLLPRYRFQCRNLVKAIEARLASLEGRSIRLRFLPELTADRRRLYSNRAHGEPVYAASYIRRRQIILDQELERDPKELARILVHELFHFVWVRLGNPARFSYEALIHLEWNRRVHGELGWSAELRKRTLKNYSRPSSVLWREYICESFCDTAAFLYSGVHGHAEYTLAMGHRKRRADWFAAAFTGGRVRI